jgi:PAS domain S-box-containing protein
MGNMEQSPIDCQHILNLSLDLICIAGMDGYFKYLNPAWEKNLGYSRDELLSRPFLDFIHPDDHAKNDEEMAKLAGGCQTLYFENRYIHKDGSMRHISWAAQAIVDEKKIYCIGRDITQRKRAEEALKESKEELKLTLDATTDGIWKWNFMTNELYFSPRYYTMLGYEPDIFPSSFESWQRLIHPDDLQSARNAAEAYLKTKPDEYKSEFRLRTKSGDYRWIRTRAKVVERNEKGEAVRMIGNHEDITERKQAEDALKVNLIKYQTLFESLPIGITISDKAGNILESNKEAERLLKLPKKEHAKRNISGPEWRIVRPDGSPMPAHEYASVKALKENRLVENVEMGIVKADGDITWINVTAIPIPLENYGVVIIYTDITERKQAEETLRESHEIIEGILTRYP